MPGRTYLDEQSALAAEERERRRSLVRGLIDGSLSAGHVPAGRFGLDAEALVIALRIAPAPGSALSPAAVRRRLRRVRTALDRAFGVEVLTLPDDFGGHAIVPGNPGGYDGAELADRLRVLCAGQVRLAAAVAAGRPDEIPAAARTAAEVLRVAQACGLPPGLHRLDDVLLEYHLSRRDESSGRVAGLLAPIADRPDR